MPGSVFKLKECNAQKIKLSVVHIAPYMKMEYATIVVSRGVNHKLDVYDKGGHRLVGFSWGLNGYSVISENLEMLKRAVITFVEQEGILLDLSDNTVKSARIFFNPNFNQWQLTVNDTAFYKSSTARSVQEMIADASRFITVGSWAERVVKTGIPMWVAQGTIKINRA